MIFQIYSTSIKTKLIYRFKGASSHKFLVDHLLKPLSECYVKRNEPTKFILDLVQVDVECLLTTQENDEDDLKVVDDFKAFLKTYVSQHDIEVTLPDHFRIIDVRCLCINCLF